MSIFDEAWESESELSPVKKKGVEFRNVSSPLGSVIFELVGAPFFNSTPGVSDKISPKKENDFVDNVWDKKGSDDSEYGGVVDEVYEGKSPVKISDPLVEYKKQKVLPPGTPITKRLGTVGKRMYYSGASGFTDIEHSTFAAIESKPEEIIKAYMTPTGTPYTPKMQYGLPPDLDTEMTKVSYREGETGVRRVLNEYLETEGTRLLTKRAEQRMKLEGMPKAFGGAILGRVEDAAVGMSRFAPAMGASAISGPVGFALTFSQIHGMRYDDLTRRGISVEVANDAAMIEAIISAPLEFAGNLFGLRVAKSAFKGVLSKAGFGVKMRKIVNNLLLGGAGEGLEEYLQKYPEELANIYADNPNASPEDMKNEFIERVSKWETFQKPALDEALTGMVGGMLLPGVAGAIATPGAIKRDIAVKKRVKRMKESGAPVDLLTGEKDVPVETVTDKASAMDLLNQAKSNVEAAIPEGPEQVFPPEVIPGVAPGVPLGIPPEGGAPIVPGAPMVEAPATGMIAPEAAIEEEQAAMGETQPEIEAPYKKSVTVEDLESMPLKDLEKVPVEDRARASLGEQATEEEVTRLADTIRETQSKAAKQYPEAKTKADIDVAASMAEEEPTKSQIEAGNYKLGKFTWKGMKTAIETAKGSMRRGVSKKGKEWAIKLKHHYGKFVGIKGADGEDIDVFMGDKTDSDSLYIIDQKDPDSGRFDELKIMAAFPSQKQATLAYMSNYESGWKGRGPVMEMTVEGFKNFSKRMNPKKAMRDQVPITREEWLKNPSYRPELYSKDEHRPGAKGDMEKATNRSIEAEYETWVDENEIKTFIEDKGMGAKETDEFFEEVEAQIRTIRPNIPVGGLKRVYPQKGGRGKNLKWKAVDLIAKIFNVPVVYFDPGNLKIKFNGVHIPSLGAIALNVKTSNPALTLFGHELNHLMQTQHRELYDSMVDYLWPKLNNDEYTSWLNDYLTQAEKIAVSLAIQEHGENYTEAQLKVFTDKKRSTDQLKEEYVGYVIGRLWNTEKFWTALAKADPTLFNRLAAFVLRNINRMKVTFQKAKYEGLYEFVDDIDSVAGHIAGVYKEMAIERKELRVPKGQKLKESVWKEVSDELSKFMAFDIDIDEPVKVDSGYFEEDLESGISGDDINRRLRERRLGYKAPSDDWLESGRIIRNIWGTFEEGDSSNLMAFKTMSAIGLGSDIRIPKEDYGAVQIVESMGFKKIDATTYRFDERIPKDVDIITGMYQAAWHIDLGSHWSTKKLFGAISQQVGKLKRGELGKEQQEALKKKLSEYVNRSWRIYREAADATSKGDQLPTKNVIVRPKGVTSGKGRQLLVQISSDVRSDASTNIGDSYYERLYAKREGYRRPSRDFWEIPEWMTRMAYFMPKADVYVIRSIEEAKKFLNQAGYDKVFFSVLDTNKRFVKDIASSYDGSIIAGGYLPDGSYYKGMKNVSWAGSMEAAATSLKVPFKVGVDPRHFAGTKTIPRLEMSKGCLYKCAFCSQDRKLKLATPEEIDEQIDAFKAYDYELVYLNDKTFGQAKNFESLIGIKERLKKENPKFKGFVIQTTAAQYLKMSDDFLRNSGIVYVEIGVETYNDKFLKSLRKPHNTKLIDLAAEKIRRLHMVFVPNVMVGLAGKEKGKVWVEDAKTYANTLNFFKKNKDIISHFNIGLLAAETGTELHKQLDANEVDTDEATMERSWFANKDVHEKYFTDLSNLGIEHLENKEIAAYVKESIAIQTGKKAEKRAPMIVGPGRMMFDLDIGEEKTPEFKEWFGDSKVVERGSPKVVYHGTYGELDYFRTRQGAAEGGQYRAGAYFSSSQTESEAYGDTIIPAYLRIEKPLDLTEFKEDSRDVDGFLKKLGGGIEKWRYRPIYVLPYKMVEDAARNQGLINKLKRKGYDGIIFNEKGAKTYVVFRPNQIKSTANVRPTEDKRIMFDIEDAPIKKKGKAQEGAKGTALGNILYWDFIVLAKEAGGWSKIKGYLETSGQWKGMNITPAAVKYIGNKADALAKDKKARNRVIAISKVRDKIASGEIEETSDAFKLALKKYGTDLNLQSIKHTKRFYVGSAKIYGPKQTGDITAMVKKDHALLGPFKTEMVRDKQYKEVTDTPIFPENYEERHKEIDRLIQEFKKYTTWYEDWNGFIMKFKHLPEEKLVKYIKMMAVFSAGSGPQGNMKQFTKITNLLESGREVKSGKIEDGGVGISKQDLPKIMAILKGNDPATNLEERRAVYGKKVGTYMHVGLIPQAEAVVIDRHMPRLWGYDITAHPRRILDPKSISKAFDIKPQVELEVASDIIIAAKRNNMTTSGVQAALWYASRVPDVEASTYQEAAALKPSTYLPKVMHAGLVPESIGTGVHYKKTPLDKGEFILATKRYGDLFVNSYSRDDIGNRMYAHTEKNPYAELVYLYESGTTPEIQLKGKKNVYTVDLDRNKIYDGINDPLGYWQFAEERLKLDPNASITNIFANMIESAEQFDGFIMNAPVGTGRWVLMLKKAEISGVPEDIVTGLSDVVAHLEKDFPQKIKEIEAIFNGRVTKLYKKFKSFMKKYPELRDEYFKPTVARFQGATGGKHEISGMANVTGPLKAARAMYSEFAISNIQNNIILIHTEEGIDRNGTFYRFKVDKRFETREKIYNEIAKRGLEDYNISVSTISGSFFIEQFVMNEASDQFVTDFSKMIKDITEKGFPQNIAYEATSEVLGDPTWSGRPAKALKYYKQNITDYFGKKEGMKRYAKAIKEGRKYKAEIRKRQAAGEPQFDVDFVEEDRKGRQQDYSRPVEGQDVTGQFAEPGEPQFDIEDAEPGEAGRAELWHSQLYRMVDSKAFPDKSKPAHMVNVINEMAKKGKIKQTELDWLGLTDWIEYQGEIKKGPLKKQDVLDFISMNNLLLEETTFGGNLAASESGRKYIANVMLSDWEKEMGVGDDLDMFSEELSVWVLYGGDIDVEIDLYPMANHLIGTFAGDYTFVDYVNEIEANEDALESDEYSQYTIDEEGSPKYRELLITMLDTIEDTKSYALEAMNWYNKKTGNKIGDPGKLALYKLEQAGVPKFLQTQFKKWQNSEAYIIPHWQSKDIKNVVAHLRFDEKTINGLRTMFIEEIQSDWAQAGRKAGFLDYSDYAPVGYHFTKDVYKGDSFVTHELRADAKPEKVIGTGQLKSEALEDAGFNQREFIKRHPLIESKNWSLMVLKRAVRYAAEHGYDQIAWTGGDIQTKRYESAFRKSVDTLIYNKKTGNLRATKSGREIFNENLNSENQLEDYVGKDNAEILIKGEAVKENEWKLYDIKLSDGDVVLEGDNIIVNEKGMKGFYDKILPSTFKKFFGKEKWGKPELKKEQLKIIDTPSVHFSTFDKRFVINDKNYTIKEAIKTTIQDGTAKYPHVLATSAATMDSRWIDGFTKNDFLKIYEQWENNEIDPKDYGYLSFDDLYGRTLLNAINTGINESEYEETADIWTAPITDKMKTKGVESAPMFDIDQEDIPAEVGPVLKDKIGRKDRRLSTRIAQAFTDFSKNWKTMMLDKMNPIKDIFGGETSAYMMHRGLPGVQSTLNALMEHGKLKMNDDGSITTDTSGDGFLKWLTGLGQDAEKFLYWQIAKRSEKLEAEGREKLLNDEDRQKIYNWVGDTPKSRDSWEDISKEFKEWNDSMLDIAVKAGLLDKESMKTWMTDYYIPFYRVFEDEASRMEFIKGPSKGKKYLSAQIKRLRGSDKPIGDPMENIIRNWSSLLSNSMANRARMEVFDLAEQRNIMSGYQRVNKKTGKEEDVPMIEKVKWSDTVTIRPPGKDSHLMFVHQKTGEPILAFRKGGKSVFFRVNDPELFSALSMVNQTYFDNVLMSVMTGAKRLLTLGATVTPAFRIANMLRDTLHTFQISKDFIPFWDTAKGFLKIWKNDPEYAKFIASGHAFGGSYIRADDPASMKKYVDRISKREGKGVIKHILDTPAKLWRFWEAVGEASENAARVQLYSNLKQKGKTHQQAAFAARDLMDFQMSGASGIVQFLIQTVPFLNARMQGLYKMGRSAVQNPAAFAFKGGLIMAASLALWALYADDDRYKELEDWEKWAYYHFWIGDKHIRIPKPFETGVLFSSSVEAAANVASGNEDAGHIIKYIGHALSETFAFNPIPQAIKPIVELYSNKSMFTGRPIESPSKKRLQPGERYDPWDSETLRALGGLLNVSPKKAKTLVQGYTASLGMGLLSVSDYFVRNLADFPERPARKIDDYPGIGRFIREGKVSRYTKYMSKFYDLYQEVDEIVGTVNNYKRIGDFEKARELTKKSRRLLAMRKGLGAARKQLGEISLETRKVWYDKTINSDDKYDRLQTLTQRRNEIVKRVYDIYLKK